MNPVHLDKLEELKSRIRMQEGVHVSSTEMEILAILYILVELLIEKEKHPHA